MNASRVARPCFCGALIGGLARLSSLLAILSGLAGCAMLRGIPDPPNTSQAVPPNPGYQLGDAAIAKYNAEADPAKRKLLRNEIIDARMAEIDRRFGEFEVSLYAEGIGTGVGTDWAVLALNTSSTLATHTFAKSVFSALSAATVGSKAALDKEVLFDKALPSLLAQMVATRETVRATIRQNEQLDVEDYTWFAAESDLNHFLFVGSLPGAIVSIAEDAGQKTTAARQELKQLTTAKFGRTPSSSLLRSYWKPGGTIDTAHEANLLAWMKDHGFAPAAGNITMFLSDSTLEASRAQAIKDLGIK